MEKSIDEVIAALKVFVPVEDEGTNLETLYGILEGFQNLEQREKAIPFMFQVFEFYPEVELGSPGPIVHELEIMRDYQS